jgi:hypothetical protein
MDQMARSSGAPQNRWMARMDGPQSRRWMIASGAYGARSSEGPQSRRWMIASGASGARSSEGSSERQRKHPERKKDLPVIKFLWGQSTDRDID